MSIPEEDIIDITVIKPMTAWTFLVSMRPCVPMSTVNPCTIPSNSEIRRWLENSAVIINGVKPKPNDIVIFPVKQLVFFPKSPKRCTVF